MMGPSFGWAVPIQFYCWHGYINGDDYWCAHSYKAIKRQRRNREEYNNNLAAQVTSTDGQIEYETHNVSLSFSFFFRLTSCD